ncbi:S9 family peptidase [Microcella alkalica]|uniref:Dipeptidyl aminopeptidase/acylaminoacyl peptidase n=1 Tax=Microcella alkalica TaxID=355930 RepID=A0A839EB27_9MICO|nr:alpha/beta fold hydrolase [Microcella alkalica]MBA8847444.1 dipeptidyl aminopeptidase/acylaminoacyl peptidase [Microcella alkalica]
MTAARPSTPFHSLDSYIALPRVEGVALSPDGERAILTVATLSSDRTRYERALWEVPANGGGAPRRLTRSAKGESGVAFTASGDALFVSSRPDAEADGEDDVAQLWLLPARGGEARPITRLSGGVSGVAATAVASDTVVIAADLLPGSDSLEDDAAALAERKKRKVKAILHESYPVRYWDHDLGPAESHLLAVELDGLADALPDRAEMPEGASDAGGDGAAADDDAAPTPYPAHLPRPRDLTPKPGRSADTAGQALTPDGRTLFAAVRLPRRGLARYELVSIDVASGERRTILGEEGVQYEFPTISRDGTRLAYLRVPTSTPAGPTDHELWVSDLDGGNSRRIAADWDRWPAEFLFSADGESLIVAADHDGRGPVFRAPLDGGLVVRLVDDRFAYANLSVDAASGDVIALRSSWQAAPHPVRIDARSGEVTELASPAAPPAPVGDMVEVETTAEDGACVRGWLLTPEGASAESPAPLLLWIHGGPLNSWNAWSWRWAPQLAVARGYAVLLPDPALSTGYGLDFIARGWNSWGQKPYTDLMAITDAVEQRPEIDETRTAAMGGSFGGYMANWVAGHTDRFRAIVSHASLWALDQFGGTTDNSAYWMSIFDAEGLDANSPHHAIDDIVTPMLVIHGDRDYRVPIGESLRLWSELNARHAEDDGSTVHRFLFFPDENHWVLKPQHAIVWYETVFAFLGQHVLGEEWARPANVG